jgi:hypothetical protein
VESRVAKKRVERRKETEERRECSSFNSLLSLLSSLFFAL